MANANEKFSRGNCGAVFLFILVADGCWETATTATLWVSWGSNMDEISVSLIIGTTKKRAFTPALAHSRAKNRLHSLQNWWEHRWTCPFGLAVEQNQTRCASTPAQKIVGWKYSIYTSIMHTYPPFQTHKARTRTESSNTKHKRQHHAEDCDAKCRHLPAINHLAYNKGVGIFFRNGMLLGLVVSQLFQRIHHSFFSYSCIYFSDPVVSPCISESKAFWRASQATRIPTSLAWKPTSRKYRRFSRKEAGETTRSSSSKFKIL